MTRHSVGEEYSDILLHFIGHYRFPVFVQRFAGGHASLIQLCHMAGNHDFGQVRNYRTVYARLGSSKQKHFRLKAI